MSAQATTDPPARSDDARSLPDALVVIPSGARRACLRREERRPAVASVPVVVTAGVVPERSSCTRPRRERHRLSEGLLVVPHACRQRRTIHLRAGHKVVLWEAVEKPSAGRTSEVRRRLAASEPELTRSQSSSTLAKAGLGGSIFPVNGTSGTDDEDDCLKRRAHAAGDWRAKVDQALAELTSGGREGAPTRACQRKGGDKASSEACRAALPVARLTNTRKAHLLNKFAAARLMVPIVICHFLLETANEGLPGPPHLEDLLSAQQPGESVDDSAVSAKHAESHPRTGFERVG